MSLAGRLEIAAASLSRIHGLDGMLLVAFEEPPAEARSWAEEHGIEVIVNPNVKPGHLFIVNPAALADRDDRDYIRF